MMLKKKIIHKLAMLLNSSRLFIKYLQYGGVKVGKECIFRDSKSARIDMTRPYLITIGNKVDINVNFQIWTHDWGSHVFKNAYGQILSSSGKVTIGNNVYFGANVTILKGVSIGDNCIIGANSVVCKSIPNNCVAVGNPCKIVSSLKDYYEKRQTKILSEAVENTISFYKRNKHWPSEDELIEEWIFYKTTAYNKPLFKNFEDFLNYCKSNVSN